MDWYTGDSTYDTVLTAALAFAGLIAVIAWFVPSPYGRFADERMGARLDPRLGWFLMELPATVSFLWFFWSGPNRTAAVPLLLCGLWLLHYGNRGFLFPLLMRVPQGNKASFGLLVVVSGWFVTATHGYLFGAFYSRFGEHYGAEWLTDPRFIGGLALYLVSFVANVHADGVVRNLRTRAEVAAGEKRYRIPRGGLFRWVTNASYLSELTAWAGLAICTWSLAGVFILAISAANLVPRAVATHRWYRDRFPDYPTERRILVPFLF